MDILSCGGRRGHVDFTGHGFADVESFLINTAAERHFGYATEAQRYVFATLAINMAPEAEITEDSLLSEAAKHLA